MEGKDALYVMDGTMYFKGMLPLSPAIVLCINHLLKESDIGHFEGLNWLQLYVNCNMNMTRKMDNLFYVSGKDNKFIRDLRDVILVSAVV